MSTDVFTHVSSQAAVTTPFTYPFSPIGPGSSFDSFGNGTMRPRDLDRSPPTLDGFPRMVNGAAIIVRKLPKNTTRDTLRSMFLFVKGFTDAEFIPSDVPEDANHLSAIVRFATITAAEDARTHLNGKPNTNGDAEMIVEMYPGPFANRRNTIDHPIPRGVPGALPSVPSLPRQSSRFNGTFQSMERISNANGVSTQPQTVNELPAPDTNSRLHSLFSPQSPIGSSILDLHHVSGKSIINQDIDEETGELLKDPVGYAQNGHSTAMPMPRRSTNPQLPTSRFSGLSLSTSMASPPLSNYNPGSAGRMSGQTSSATLPPNINGNMGGNPAFHYPNQHNSRHSLPAANPNDLNPPCNTLYVGNLPADTQEEELKALFSKQRGYKRLCFRNKQNGPMCFVEFDEVAMASKALNELYGYKLSNSVKTGIRLSFSKNPLGVRSGQPGSSVNPSTPLSPQSPLHGINGVGGMPASLFATASGPPPGLSVPPGLAMPLSLRNGSLPPSGNPHVSAPNAGNFSSMANGLGIRTNGMNTMSSTTLSGGIPGSGPAPGVGGFGNVYPDYMMGR